MSFTDQLPHQITQDDIDSSKRLVKHDPRQELRCYLCGIEFVLGDTRRWIYANGTKENPGHGCGNFFVCVKCDGDDVLTKWQKAYEELLQRFWWMDPKHRGCR